MSAEKPILKARSIALPDIPALCVNARNAAILTTDGEVQILPHAKAAQEIKNQAVLVCHAPYTRSRLGFEEFYTFDVLELFAFVHPVKFCVPTPAGLAKALHLSPPEDFEDAPFSLIEIARALLADLQNDPHCEKADPLKIAAVMGLKGNGWPWTPFIFSALGHTYDRQEELFSRSALNVWKHLPEWADEAPEAPPSHFGVTAQEAQERLAEMLGRGDKKSEIRPQQKDYSTSIAKMFGPVQEDMNPHLVLAEAGTGVGKTLGYLAPASVWTEKNDDAVWISTYTKNLQRQIDSELDRLYPHPQVKDAYVAVRKGRENYLCLLNLEDLSAGVALSVNPRHAVAAGIMARWVAVTKDGDLSGGEFQGWLSGLLGIANTQGLSDRRGECLFSACDHYHRCFVERSVRKSKRARLVIANHALVMVQSALASPLETLPTRYIFDEGHHLFDAADSAFAAHLTARESSDLRRWILGAEEGRKSRARGLKKRVEDLIAGDKDAESALQDIIHHATSLPAFGWSRRLKDESPSGVCEIFLAGIYAQVMARSEDRESPYSLETQLHPADPSLIEKAEKVKNALTKLLKPMEKLSRLLMKRLQDDQGQMDSDTRKRHEALSISIDRRSSMVLKAWIAMLDTLQSATPAPGFVDWLEIERADGQAIDVGLYRHFIDPMRPFTASIRPHLHGMAVTSATLRDNSTEEKNWDNAHQRTGVSYLSKDCHEESFDSPFDYATQTKIFIINDVNKNDINQVSSAYRALFTASGGGGLGLFTSIQRLRGVYARIAQKLNESDISLYAQHVDDMDAGTLIDIFRDDIHACLLGTDAVRDGVDVPGSSLRLLVFDRVPWPRPTILHKARREAFGNRHYDEMITRLKLKQAFGRLIRRESDRGVFVMLDPSLPSRLQTAFPHDVEIRKTGLTDAVKDIQDFFKN